METTDNKFRDLIEIIQITEKISAKIHGLEDSEQIYATVIEEFRKLKNYDCSFMLLTEDGKHLYIKGLSLTPEILDRAINIAGISMENFRISLDKSGTYRSVAREGKTVHYKNPDLIAELVPKQIASLAAKVLGYSTQMNITTPLYMHGRIIGTFGMNSPELLEGFLPSVESLSRHISAALNLADTINKRKKAEQALKESEELFLNTFRMSPTIGVITSFEEGRFIEVNDAFLKTTGLKREEVMGKSAFDLGMIDTAVAKSSREILKKEGFAITETEVNLKEGKKLLGIFYARTMLINGELCIMQSVVDVTEKRKTEQALKESEERIVEIIKLLPEVIFEMDLEGRLIFLNKRGFDISGYTREDFDQGIKVTSLIASEEHTRLAENIRIVLSGKDIGIHEYTIIRKDGTIFPALIHSSPILKEGKPAGLRGILIDITEKKKSEEYLKESEERFRLMAETSPDCIFQTDKNGTIIYASPSMISITGYAPEERIGAKYSDMFFSDPSKGKALLKNMLKKEAIRNMDVAIHHKNGREVFVEVSAARLLKNGKVESIFGIARDITERKNAEKLINEQRLSLESKNVALKEIIEQVASEKKQMQEKIHANFQKLVLPKLDKMKIGTPSSARKKIDLLEKNLEAICSSYGVRVSKEATRLSPKELEVSDMIRNGMSNKEIAESLGLSVRTVETVRKHIRAKFNIKKKSINLKNYLSSIP
jgi:PAS domain S-box-containing protein